MSESLVDTNKKYPVLPLLDIVVFPHMVVPLFVGRAKSVKAMEEAIEQGKHIVLVTQRSSEQEDPTAGDLYDVGVIAEILQLLKLPDGTIKVLAEGKERIRIDRYTSKAEYFEAFIEPIKENMADENKVEGLSRTCISEFDLYVKLNRKIPTEVITAVSAIEDPAKLADTIASHLSVKIEQRQKVLEIADIAERLEHLFSLMEGEISILEVEKKVRSRVKTQMEKTQREYYLNEQMKAIQKELNDGELDEIAELEDKIKKARMPKEAKHKCESELKKLKQMSPMSAEATVHRNYLDWMVSLPWKKKSKILKDLTYAEKILNEDHYGLEKVKERVLEYLAVQNRVDKIKGSILCLVGPPGVGKTSLGKSIARATNREFVRIALGGIKDEAEVRGHRKTYIGAMPGKIIQSMKKAGVVNPLFLLDEIDKLGNDWRGDPSSALLEVLDPEQNNTFNDHYLEVDYDLSDVMFICTANSLDLPPALLDRMEVIRISGYTEEEKLEIAKRHLTPKQVSNNGLNKKEIEINDDAILDLIRYYTREAGVRNLEREISKIARKVVKDITTNPKKKSIKVTDKNLNDFSGVRRFDYGRAEGEDRIGRVTGLAWTEVGGDLLQIEAVKIPKEDKGFGHVTMTGKLGDVMKESIQVAEMLVKSRMASFGVKPCVLKKYGIHIHVPEGATPKDGPSAGLAMVTAIVSTLTSIAIRKDIAMTGEVDLLGNALPIGGLKEKLLAALRGNIKKVLIPKDNLKDLDEIPDNVKKGMEIVAVSSVEEVIKHALISVPKPISDEEYSSMMELANKCQDETAVRH